jgi:hypothetical protein
MVEEMTEDSHQPASRPAYCEDPCLQLIMTGAKEEERQEKTCELQESMSLNWVRRKIEGLDR